jgi:flagellar motor switch protein FliN/FliY
MSEILSQAQIDSLLGQSDMVGAPMQTPDEFPGTESGGQNYDALTNVFDLFNEQASTVVSTILNKQVSCEIVTCQKTDMASVATNVESPALILTIPFKSGIQGALSCVVAKKDVAYLSDLMMMGDGSAAYTDDHKDAIVELMSQVMGSFTTALGGKFGEQVGVDAITAAEFDFANPPFPLDTTDAAHIKVSLAGGNECQLIFFTQSDVSMELMGKMAKANRPEAGSREMSEENAMGGSTSADLSSRGQGESFVETSLSGHSMRSSAGHENIDMLLDVDLEVYIELGRTNLSIKRVLDLAPGSIVELDRLAGEPVDLLVNDKVVAKGEVVVVDENFGIRIVSLVSAEDRIKSLK